MCDIAGFFHGQSAGLALDHCVVEAASITGSIICGVF